MISRHDVGLEAASSEVGWKIKRGRSQIPFKKHFFYESRFLSRLWKHLVLLLIFECNNKIYMLYNGNNFGKTGFGIAELIQ